MKDLPPNHDEFVERGWPTLSYKGREDFKNFIHAEPIELPPGTRIYRIVDEQNPNAGAYWAYELPGSKAAWRRGYGVKDAWNDNGYYVEHVVGEDGLKVWEGTTAGQEYLDRKFHLPGGEKQLFMTPGSIPEPTPKLTGWPEP